ncbi:hypothetical protein ACJ72_06554 [Emergomyces africanus]|uniref:Uncharacterized protein n=1 Tax=Emergomyces africanus TaxID=1955775 RepID=A0A1B7NQR5_9EURO|nr:hypothetical protein ACJ72_06554 [Emergomyces africanus]
MAQLLFKFCFILFMIEFGLASPFLIPASISTNISPLSKPIDIPHNEPLAEFTLLGTRDDTEHPAENTSLTTAQKLQDNNNNNNNNNDLANLAANSPGMCHFHLWEIQRCNGDDDERYARLEMWDARSVSIVSPNNPENGGKGPRIDQGVWRVKSALRNDLLVRKDVHELRFRYGALNWLSNTGSKNRNPYCKKGRWDPDPSWIHCHLGRWVQRTRQMDCFFPC